MPMPQESQGASNSQPATSSSVSSPVQNPGPSTPPPQVEPDQSSQEKKPSLTTEELFSQAEKELSGKKDEVKPELGQEGPPPIKEPQRRFKTHDDAEKAALESQAKIDELTRKIEELQKKPDASQTNSDDDADGEEGDLTEEELDVLWEEDPKAARAYERKLYNKRLDEVVNPFKEVLSKIEEERTVQAETIALGGVKERIDAEFGKGQFEAIIPKIDDQKFLETLLAQSSPAISTVVRGLIKSNDRVATLEILAREAISHARKTNQKKSEQSIPSETGSAGNQTISKIPVKKGATAEELWAVAEKELKVKT